MTEVHPQSIDIVSDMVPPTLPSNIGAIAIESPVHEVIEQPIHLNKVEELMSHEFSDPSLWAAKRKTVYNFLYGVGVENETEGKYDLVICQPELTWIGSIYGHRVVHDEKSKNPKAVKTLSTSLETVTAIHNSLNGGALRDEGIRVATLITPPDTKHYVTNPVNVNLWLNMIRHGEWPIMLVQQNGKTAEPLDHDYADYHLGNMALFPREVQDLITEATVHELAWRKKYFDDKDDKVKEKFLLIGNEQRGDLNPHASGQRGNVSLSESGVNKIDNITDVRGYMPILGYIVDHPEQPCIDRLRELMSYDFNGEVDNSIFKPAAGLNEMRSNIADLVNFNSRHRSSENATPELVEHEYQKFLTGVVRVAQKIRGEHPEVA